MIFAYIVALSSFERGNWGFWYIQHMPLTLELRINSASDASADWFV